MRFNEVLKKGIKFEIL